MLTRRGVSHTHTVTPRAHPLTSVVVREHANGTVTPIAAGYAAQGVPHPSHPAYPSVRPLPGGTPALTVPTGGPRPRGPVVDSSGRRQPCGVGTDLTDPSTWQRTYMFPGGNHPVTPKLHFS